jgi:hypothetical protein
LTIELKSIIHTQVSLARRCEYAFSYQGWLGCG